MKFKIVIGNNKIELLQNDYGFYAVFRYCKGFAQQISKWYFYKKCAINKFNSYN